MIKKEIEVALEPYLREEKYPYELGLMRGFAFAILQGNTDFLIEAFESASAGQGVNSKARYSEAIQMLQAVPGLVEDQDSEIPFPTRVPRPDGVGMIIQVQNTPIREIQESISRFS